MSNTSIGRGPAHGSNENHDGDPRHKTLGEAVSQEEPPAGNVLEEAATDVPTGVAGHQVKPGTGKGPASDPVALNVDSSPRGSDAARGQTPKER